MVEPTPWKNVIVNLDHETPKDRDENPPKFLSCHHLDLDILQRLSMQTSTQLHSPAACDTGRCCSFHFACLPWLKWPVGPSRRKTRWENDGKTILCLHLKAMRLWIVWSCMIYSILISFKVTNHWNRSRQAPVSMSAAAHSSRKGVGSSPGTSTYHWTLQICYTTWHVKFPFDQDM